MISIKEDNKHNNSTIIYSKDAFTVNYKTSIMVANRQTKEEINMSFVGMFRTREGVFCFADNRSSKNNDVDFERPFITKMFENESIILITYGYNKILNLNSEDEPIEWTLNEIICKKNRNINEFVNEFGKVLEEHKDTKRFNFIILNKSNFRIMILHFENFSYMIDISDIEYFYASPDWLKPLFENSFIAHWNSNVKLNDIKNYFTNKIIPILEVLEDKGVYSHVSKTFDVVEHRLNETKKYTLGKIDE